MGMSLRAQGSERCTHWLEFEILDQSGGSIETCPVVVEASDDEGCLLRSASGAVVCVRHEEWYVPPDRRWRCRTRMEADEGLLAPNPDGIARELVITHGRAAPPRLVRVPPSERMLTIGRSPAEADVVIADRKVSAVHARMHFEGAGSRVHDLGSRNGLTVNGAAVAGSTTLVGESVVGIGFATVALRDLWPRVAEELAQAAPRRVLHEAVCDDARDSSETGLHAKPHPALSRPAGIVESPAASPEQRVALPQAWVIYAAAVVGISGAVVAAMRWLA
jgi:hypothetical protein